MQHKILPTYKFTNSLQQKIWMIHGYKIIPIVSGFLTFQKLKQGTYMWVSRGKKCLFFRKFGVLCFLLTPVLKSALFALLLRKFDICKIFCIYAKCLNCSLTLYLTYVSIWMQEEIFHSESYKILNSFCIETVIIVDMGHVEHISILCSALLILL